MKNFIVLILLVGIVSCGSDDKARKPKEKVTSEKMNADMQKNLDKYVSFKLTSDMTVLSEKEREMIPILIEAAKEMNKMFWYEAYGDKQTLLESIEDDATKKFVKINYGPWDRLANNKPLVKGVDAKPAGANFYPADMSKEEFEQFEDDSKNSMYTFVRRDEAGKLITIPYHKQFEAGVKKVAELLMQAAELAEDEGLKNYLELRAQAFLDDNYQPSDLAWMDMKNNTIDVVIGPIETYEDQLYGNKAAHEAYVLIKDQDWSAKLAKYADFLPELQRGIPVDDAYKQETPGTDSDLNAYDVVYYAGDCNSGSKTIAINLPNDEEVQLQKGTRRLQLKNAMRAKFAKLLVPIAEELITPEQRQ